MDAPKIQYEPKKRNIAQKSIAANLGLSEFHVSEVIHKNRVSDRVVKAIAKATGRDHRVTHNPDAGGLSISKNRKTILHANDIPSISLREQRN